ncbi:L,D-transpeptidase [Rhizobium sp. 768_B6_N1_8]|uniref:L,D-transpeptidase n=1 Tax=unclassified Rhizobium TaxID=2613769 RepID=UPI003F22B3AF
MRLLAILAAALLMTVVQAHAQYDGYDEYDGYSYDDPYNLYPPSEYEPVPRYRGALPNRAQQSRTKESIVIVTGEHTLYYATPWGEQYVYPIAVGREGKQWFGSTRVVSKKAHPEWRPTASMRQKNPKLPTVMKPGPNNPLGTRAIYLADRLLRIHGTNDPSSIGTNASSGRFRMYRQDVEELYKHKRLRGRGWIGRPSLIV